MENYLADLDDPPASRFEETAAGFQVTLVGHGSALIGDQVDAHRWRHLGVNGRQEMALAYVAEKGRLTNREHQELCPKIGAETIRRDLADLVRKDLLPKFGEKRATYYIFKRRASIPQNCNTILQKEGRQALAHRP